MKLASGALSLSVCPSPLRIRFGSLHGIKENIRGGLHAISQNNSAILLDKLGNRDPAIYDLRHAETKKDNLSIPCACRCLEYLPPFTFKC